MSLKTEETFQLQAPADRVWEYLIDPRRVVTCLPGAELTSVQDESTFLGKVKVKVGPVVAAYSGKVVITERDDAARVVRMVGEGRESAGGGSAKVSITSAVVALAEGMTEVRVTADLDIVGKIAQFGRGMIESVNKQMFRQFTECVRATLERPVEAETAPAAASAPPSMVPQAGAQAPISPTGPGGGFVASPGNAPSPAPPDNTRVAQAASPGTGTGQPPFATAQPVRLLPLLARAVWDYVTGFVRRAFRRKPRVPR